MSNQVDKQDILNLINIIELAASRGAFRMAEMTAIGQTYDKVAKTLNDDSSENKQLES